MDQPCIDNRYQVIRQLGQGGTAQVYLVEDVRRGGKRLALKRLAGAADPEVLRIEFEVLGRLTHPNLAALYDLELASDPPYLTGEYVSGPDLATWARSQPLPQILEALIAVLHALCLLHDRNWVHGDLKPGNILVEAEHTRPKLVDLGLARRGGGQRGGTAGYAAPELLTGAGGTARSDVYAFAVVALEVLSGRRAFAKDAVRAVDHQLAGQSILSTMANLPPPLTSLLDTCLQPDPLARPRSAVTLFPRFAQAVGREPSAILRRTSTLPEAALIGYEAQQQLIEDLCHRVSSGEAGPRVLAISGEHGLGKTRLLTEARHVAVQQGYQCFWADSFYGMLTQLGSAVGARQCSEPSVEGPASPLEPHLAAMIDGLLPGPTPRFPHLPGLSPAIRLQQAVQGLATRIARQRPLALFFDDVHNYEPVEHEAFFRYVHDLSREDAETTPVPLALFFSQRESSALEKTVQPLALHPLTCNEGILALRSMLPGENIAEDTLCAIWRFGAGNPWLMRESLLCWLSLSAAERDGEQLAYPDRILAVARERLAALDEHEMQVLLALALAPELDARAARALAVPLSEGHLQRLLGRRLIVEQIGEDTVNLRLGGEHLRQVLLLGCSPSARTMLATRVAQTLEQLGGPPHQAASYWEQGEDPQRAAQSYLQAAESGFDYRGRWALRAAALSTPGWPRWSTAKRAAARQLWAAGDPEHAQRQLQDLVDQQHAEEEDRLALGQLAILLGEPGRALAAVAISDAVATRLTRAQAHLLLGHHEAAQAQCAQLPSSGGRDNILGLIALAQGELDQATRHFAQAEQRFAAENDQLGLAKATNNLAIVHQAHGDLPGARTWYLKAIEHARAAGDPLRAVHCRLNHGTVCQRAGELIARAIHRVSARSTGPMISINCGGLPTALLTSELFGHVRGAFTGAVRNYPGMFRMAHRGTLFLDEVTEMSPELQVQLLRVLQSGTFHPVGGEQEVQVDVRVISASNHDMERARLRDLYGQDASGRDNSHGGSTLVLRPATNDRWSMGPTAP